ncbi:MAG: efflux RND transporter permease subunit [Bacteroidota bacterium]
MVQTTYPNAMPEEVEKQITEPLESAVGTVTGVKKVTSVSKEGVSVNSVRSEKTFCCLFLFAQCFFTTLIPNFDPLYC